MSACSSCSVFCQISAEPGRLTLRHAVWSWDMPHTRSLPRRLLQDCMQALSYFVKTINEPECLILRQAVQLQDILSVLETCLTQDYCQDARDKIACKLSSFFKNVNEQIVWLWDRAAAMWQNITRLGIGTIITWIVIWNTFSVTVPVNHLETEQSTRVRISRKFVSKNFKVLYWFCIKYLEQQCMSYIVIKIRRFSS